VCQADRDHQEAQSNPDCHVEQDALGAPTRVKDTAFLPEDASQAGASGLHEDQHDQADRQDQLGET